MEDHNRSRNQTNSADEENIIELSAEMALTDQKKHKIIDLTDDIDNPVKQDVTPPLGKQPVEEVAELSEDTHPDEPVDGSTPSVSDVNDFLATSEKEQPVAIINETTEQIEDEVDAAFDAVAVQTEEPTPSIGDDLLFDKLSDITQEVDEAVGKADRGDPADVDQLPCADAAPIDDEDLSAQSAELEAALAGDDDHTETVIPPDVESQQGHEFADDIEEIQDDDIDIIDLVDVVDPAKIDNLESEATEEDDDIIELTRIVDIAELESFKAKQQIGKAEIETSSLPDAEQAQGKSAEEQNREEELSLLETDDGSDFQGNLEGSADTDDIFDSAELDGLFDDDISEDETIGDIEPLSDNTDTESDFTVEDTNELFDIVDDFISTESSEQVTFDDIESIPSLGKTDGLIDDDISEDETTGDIEPLSDDTDAESDFTVEDTNELFDIVDDFISTESSEEETSEAMDTEPIAPLEEKTEDQEQVLQLAQVLSASRPQQPHSEHSPISPEGDDSVEDSALFEDNKIEAAVEKIIRIKYADKMEQLIAIAVEKAVTQEIENIKRSLTDNDEPPE
jgi:hypothetical protein